MSENISREQVENLIKMVSSHLGKKPSELESSVKQGKVAETLTNLKPEDAQKIQKILSDKNATSKILSTPQAQQMMKKILGDK